MSGPFNISNTAGFVNVDTSTFAKTITMPLAASRPGRIITIKDRTGNAGNNNIIINRQGSDTFDGGATSYLINMNYGSASFISRGNQWLVEINANNITTVNIPTYAVTSVSVAGGLGTNAANGAITLNGTTIQTQVVSSIQGLANVAVTSLSATQNTTVSAANGAVTITGPNLTGYATNTFLTSTVTGLSNVAVTNLTAGTNITLSGGPKGAITVNGPDLTGYVTTGNIATYAVTSLAVAGGLGTTGANGSITVNGTSIQTQVVSSIQGLANVAVTNLTAGTNISLTGGPKGAITVNGPDLTPYATNTSLTSTVTGLNTYINSFIDPTELTSSVVGLGTLGFISAIGLSYQIASTVQGLGTFGYISTAQLLSTTVGLYGAIGSNIQTTVQPQFTSTVTGLGTAGYVSSLQLVSTVSGLGNVAVTSLSASQNVTVNQSRGVVAITGPDLTPYATNTSLTSTVTGLNNVAVTNLTAGTNISFTGGPKGAITVNGPNLGSYFNSVTATAPITTTGTSGNSLAIQLSGTYVNTLTTAGGITSNGTTGNVTIDGSSIQTQIVSSVQGLANVAVTNLTAGTNISFTGGPKGAITVNGPNLGSYFNTVTPTAPITTTGTSGNNLAIQLSGTYVNSLAVGGGLSSNGTTGNVTIDGSSIQTQIVSSVQGLANVAVTNLTAGTNISFTGGPKGAITVNGPNLGSYFNSVTATAPITTTGTSGNSLAIQLSGTYVNSLTTAGGITSNGTTGAITIDGSSIQTQIVSSVQGLANVAVTSLSATQNTSVNVSKGAVTITGPNLGSYFNSVTATAPITTTGTSGNSLAIQLSGTYVNSLATTGGITSNGTTGAITIDGSSIQTQIVSSVQGLANVAVTSLSATQNTSVNVSKGAVTITGPNLGSYFNSVTATAPITTTGTSGNSLAIQLSGTYVNSLATTGGITSNGTTGAITIDGSSIQGQIVSSIKGLSNVAVTSLSATQNTTVNAANGVVTITGPNLGSYFNSVTATAPITTTGTSGNSLAIQLSGTYVNSLAVGGGLTSNGTTGAITISGSGIQTQIVSSVQGINQSLVTSNLFIPYSTMNSNTFFTLQTSSTQMYFGTYGSTGQLYIGDISAKFQSSNDTRPLLLMEQQAIPVPSSSPITVTFNYTGSDQSFVVPDGVATLSVTLSGAGGGSDYATGGAGGLVQGTCFVAAGTNLIIVVGQGGQSSGAATYGGGGSGVGNGFGSSGGGRSAIQIVSGTDFVTAGGGGGGGKNGGAGSNGAGGNGGGSSGSSGNGGVFCGGGGGGSSSGGGGGSGSANGSSGTLIYGGSGGGGGGGGWYGGGGGGTYAGQQGYAGGGGGSALTSNLLTVTTNSQGGGSAASTNGYVQITYTITLAGRPGNILEMRNWTPRKFIVNQNLQVGINVSSLSNSYQLDVNGSAHISSLYIGSPTPGLLTTDINGTNVYWNGTQLATTAAGITGGQLVSTVTGLGTAGYTSNTQLLSTSAGITSLILLAPNLTSTVAGLGAAGYISTAQFLSTSASLVLPSQLKSTINNLLVPFSSYSTPNFFQVYASTSQLYFGSFGSTSQLYIGDVVAANSNNSITTPVVILEQKSFIGPIATTLTYTGSDQTFTVPAGITSITVSLSGAGGGGSGGSGGLVSGTYAVTPGQVLTVVVGGAGQVSNSITAYGGGGRGGGSSGYPGGGGGGRTAIRVSGSDVITAAGGGGGASIGYQNISGGAGGGTTGNNGNGGGAGSGTGGKGLGATQTAVGDSGYGCTGASGNQGGSSGSGAGGVHNGGGGGGGWFGGGAGASDSYNACGSGGGGSSYSANLTGTVLNVTGGGSGAGSNGTCTITYLTTTYRPGNLLEIRNYVGNKMIVDPFLNVGINVLSTNSNYNFQVNGGALVSSLYLGTGSPNVLTTDSAGTNVYWNANQLLIANTLTSTVTGIGNVAITPTNIPNYAVTYLTTSGGITSNAAQGAVTISGSGIQTQIVSSVQGLGNVAVTSLSASQNVTVNQSRGVVAITGPNLGSYFNSVTATAPITTTGTSGNSLAIQLSGTYVNSLATTGGITSNGTTGNVTIDGSSIQTQIVSSVQGLANVAVTNLTAGTNISFTGGPKGAITVNGPNLGSYFNSVTATAPITTTGTSGNSLAIQLSGTYVNSLAVGGGLTSNGTTGAITISGSGIQTQIVSSIQGLNNVAVTSLSATRNTTVDVSKGAVTITGPDLTGYVTTGNIASYAVTSLAVGGGITSNATVGAVTLSGANIQTQVVSSIQGLNNVAVTSLSATRNTSVDVSKGAVTITGPDLTSYATNTFLTSTVTGLSNVAVTSLSASQNVSVNRSNGIVAITGPDLTGYATNTFLTSTVTGLSNVAVTSLSATQNTSVNVSKGAVTITGPNLGSYFNSVTATAPITTTGTSGNSLAIQLSGTYVNSLSVGGGLTSNGTTGAVSISGANIQTQIVSSIQGLSNVAVTSITATQNTSVTRSNGEWRITGPNLTSYLTSGDLGSYFNSVTATSPITTTGTSGNNLAIQLSGTYVNSLSVGGGLSSNGTTGDITINGPDLSSYATNTFLTSTVTGLSNVAVTGLTAGTNISFSGGPRGAVTVNSSSSWVGTATSILNMSGCNISNVGTYFSDNRNLNLTADGYDIAISAGSYITLQTSNNTASNGILINGCQFANGQALYVTLYSSGAYSNSYIQYFSSADADIFDNITSSSIVILTPTTDLSEGNTNMVTWFVTCYSHGFYVTLNGLSNLVYNQTFHVFLPRY